MEACKTHAELAHHLFEGREVSEVLFKGSPEKEDIEDLQRVLNELGSVYYARAKQERGEKPRTERERYLHAAVEQFVKALSYDPENAAAHYNLKQIYNDLGNSDLAEKHAQLHAKYKSDDNARDRAFARARARYPAANHAAEAVVIYDLQRPGAYGLPEQESRGSTKEGGR